MAVSGLFLISCNRPVTPKKEQENESSRDIAYYTCSMHPQIRSDKPGTCPICGMNLVPVRTHAPTPQAVAPAPAAPKATRKIDYYTCSMHPQIHADKPGKCPICGMDLMPVYVPEPGGQKPATSEVRLTEEGIRQAAVRTDPTSKRPLAKELLIFGTLGYDLNLHRDVESLVEGRIERQFVDFNQTEVRQGDPLVEIYSPEALRLQEEYLKTLRERWLSTFYERSVLDSMIQLSRARLEHIGFTSEDLQSLENEKKPRMNVIVRAPISGSIIGNMVHIGEMAKLDMPLYHVVPLDKLWFNGQVFEPDLGLLKIGQKVRITTKSFPGETFSGTLAYVGRSLEASNRTIPVRFTVPNRDRRLLPNLSATGELEIPLGENVLSVPNSAVLNLGTRQVVYVQKENGVFVQRDVRIGHVTTHYTQILDGLTEGEPVVTAGAFLIDAQAQLRGSVSDEVPVQPGSETSVPVPEASVHHH